MHVPDRLITPFDMKIDNKGYESDLEDELIEMYVDFEAKALFKIKTSEIIGALSILLLSTPSSEQQSSLSYFHSKLHPWLKLALAM